MADRRPSLVTLSGVTKTYVAGGVTHDALRQVDLSVSAGEFVSVVGPSGSGKSTLLNVIAGIDRPTAGEVVVDGVVVSALGEDAAARWRGRQLGVVFQFFQLLPTLTLAENVMLPMDYCHVHPRRRRPRVALDLLALVDVADQADRLPSQVSGGQQQRAAIARALANDAPTLLADEPTGNLDSVASGAVMDLFGRLVGDGRTILMVTHDRDLAARGSRTVAVRDGRVRDEPPGGRTAAADHAPGEASREPREVTASRGDLAVGP